MFYVILASCRLDKEGCEVTYNLSAVCNMPLCGHGDITKPLSSPFLFKAFHRRRECSRDPCLRSHTFLRFFKILFILKFFTKGCFVAAAVWD